MNTVVDLVWFNAGGGHKAAAAALSQGIDAAGLPWRVRSIDLVQVLDPTALFRRSTGMAPEDLYNKRLASGFTLGLRQELKLLQGGIRLAHPRLVQRLAAHWARTRPDLVVSLIPNFNRALHDALALARPGAPFVTVMTDLADLPPHFWAEPGTAQHLVCGTAHAAAQALAAGMAPSQVHRVHGMLLRPGFHATPPSSAERRAARVAAGLPADGAVGLVLFGGTGSRAMLAIARALPETPLVLLCGRNAALVQALQREPAAAPRVVLGTTSDVAHWMHLADFFVGKPGPGSLSEAVQCGLPVITTCNTWTLPQERWNADWVRDEGLGLVLRRFADIDVAVPALLSRLGEFKANAARVRHDALQAVPALLQQLVAPAARPSTARAADAPPLAAAVA
jgi:1,2-diacylglycerol 3-beta-galactosyltransferase